MSRNKDTKSYKYMYLYFCFYYAMHHFHPNISHVHIFLCFQIRYVINQRLECLVVTQARLSLKYILSYNKWNPVSIHVRSSDMYYKLVWNQLKWKKELTNCTYKEVMRERHLCISLTLRLSVSCICSNKK